MRTVHWRSPHRQLQVLYIATVILYIATVILYMATMMHNDTIYIIATLWGSFLTIAFHILTEPY